MTERSRSFHQATNRINIHNMIRTFIVAVLLAVALAPPAEAQYVPNYETWKNLPKSQKTGFVMGLFDFWLTTSDTPDQYAFGGGIGHCSNVVKFSGNMLRDAVDQAYLRQPGRWEHPATVLVRGVLHHMCLKHINTAREIDGLKPWLPWDDW